MLGTSMTVAIINHLYLFCCAHIHSPKCPQHCDEAQQVLVYTLYCFCTDKSPLHKCSTKETKCYSDHARDVDHFTEKLYVHMRGMYNTIPQPTYKGYQK